MNTLIFLGLGFLSALFPQTLEMKINPAVPYTCSVVQWVKPANFENDGHLRGQADVQCDLSGATGAGFPGLEAYLRESFLKQVTHVYSGPVRGSYDSLPATAWDVDLGLTFSGKPATARELMTLATDERTRLVSYLKMAHLSGTSYDDYIKSFDFTLDIAAVPVHSNYHGTLSVAIDLTKPWYAPSGVFQSEVVKAVEGAVTNYRDTLISELQNHL